MAAAVTSPVLNGRAEVKNLFGQVGRWHIAPAWYAVAQLLVLALPLVGLA